MGEIQYPAVPLKADGLDEKQRDAEIHSGDSELAQSADIIDGEAQFGVQGVEAIATVWSKTTLIVVYILICFVFFIVLLQQGAESALNPYVTSAFQQHSLTATVGVISNIVGGVCNLTVAKVLDVFGRPQGYLVSLVITTIGIAMMAATTTVEMYAAAQVFWTVGNNALLYSVGILVADTTKMRNRALMAAVTFLPNMVTIWIGGPISEAFLNGPGWQWCLGAFSIIVPITCLPMFVILMINYLKAKKQGLITAKETTRNPWQTFVHHCREFDAVGLVLLSGGLAMFLLPFNIATLQPLGWQSPLIICLLVFGVVLIILFALWERFLAPVTFIPYSLLLDRNMIGSCMVSAVLFVSFFCWNSFFSSFLQVVNNLTVSEASYVVQIYGVGSTLSSVLAGLYIRYTGRFKNMNLYVAIPIYTLFMGLMIYFREPDANIGYIVMCQIFISFAGGVIVITPQVASMAVASHQHVAVVIAVISMFSSIGGAVGLTVAGAIWQAIFPVKLAEYLPAEDQANLLEIYGGLDVQLSYPVGTPARIAIQQAYADAQAMMLTAGTAIWVVGFVGVALWRNVDVKHMKQVKGHVI